MLDIKRLQYLVAVYRYHSFTRASEELFVSQSAISMAIKSLEAELGVQLIVRSPQNVDFTQEGKLLVKHALRILLDCENAEREIADLSESKSYTVHLGLSPSLGFAFQRFLYTEELRRAYPKATLYIEEGSMNNHIVKIQQDLMDLSFNALPCLEDGKSLGLNLVPITTARIYAIMCPTHPLANRAVLTAKDFEGVDIVTLDERSAIRTLVMSHLKQSGITPCVRSSHEQIFCMLNTIKFGNFVGFINADAPYMVQHLHQIGLILRQFEPALEFQAGFLSKAGKTLPRIAESLIVKARELAQKSPSPML